MKKLLELLNNNQLDDLRIELTKRLLKEEHKSPKLLQAIKNYFKKAPKERPVLQTIQHTKDNKQFICDGFSIYYFNDYISEFDALPQSDYTISINPQSILATINPQNKPSDTTLNTIRDIKKYIAFAKTLPQYDKKEQLTITINDVPFQAYLIEQLNDIIPTEDIISLDIAPNGMFITTQTIKALVLPVRYTKQDYTKEFINME
jgi:hypothetical protein